MSLISQDIEAKYGNSIKAKAAMLLGKNISTGTTASLLGVSDSLVSQYKEDPEFAELVSMMQIESTLAASMHDAKLDELESRAVDKLSEVLDYVSRPMEVVAMVKAINSLTRRSAQVPLQSNELSNVAVLELPKGVGVRIAVELKYNTSNEVVEVNERPMQTMSSANVAQLMQNRGRVLEHTGEAT